MLEVMKQVVAATLAALGAEDLAHGDVGCVSVAEHGSGLLLVTGLGMAAREAVADGVAEVVLATGAPAAGPQPADATGLHLALVRAGHGAVISTPAPHVAALALVADAIPCVLGEQAARVGGPSPVVADDPAAIVAALAPGGMRACAVRHGGLVAAAPDLVGALAAALALEAAARAVLLARAAGGTPAELAGS